MFGDKIAHLGQLEHLMNLIGFGMDHHVPATASAIGGRVMRNQGQAGIKRMPLAAMFLVTGLRAPLLAGRRALTGRRRCTGAVAGRRLGGVAAVLMETVLQLGDAVEELINQLVGLLEGKRWHDRCRLLFCHVNEHATRAGSCNRQMGIKG